MKTNTIRIIIIFSSIALIGLLITQLFWIKNAVKLSGQQFDHRVNIALKDALADLNKINNDSLSSSCCGVNEGINRINFDILDSLLKAHFINSNLDTIYQFSIVKCNENQTVYKHNGHFDKELPVTCHKTGMSCINEMGCYDLKVFFPDKQKFIIFQMLAWLLSSVIFILIVIFFFAFIIFKLLQQKKLSEMKNDFINNMTHEFKTPISTISLASEVLMNTQNQNSTERVNKYSKVIFDEIQRLKSLVERVLQIAVIEKQEFKLNITQIDLHELIKSKVNNLCLEQCTKSVKIDFQLNAKNAIIDADELHISNIIINILENAYKYSGDSPEITIITENLKDAVSIKIIDKGIGMSEEVQKHIFDKFYRAHSGNIHDTKGFGLGLYYVKTLTEAHNGKITVTSEINKGSTFQLVLPQ